MSLHGEHTHVPVPVLKAFEAAAKGKDFVDAADFVCFLANVQGESNMTLEEAGTLIAKFAPTSHHLFSREKSDVLNLESFLKYLLDPTLNAALVITHKPTHDMAAPLSHYYIHTSHNSYLTGNQLTSKSKSAAIVDALKSGCRVIELDCWPRGGNIMVLHGYTLTKSVAFEECVQAIKDNAFVASEYPVIITIENHLDPALQQKASQILRDIIGEALYIPKSHERPPKRFGSPEDLKGRIIISDKPPQETIGQADPRGALEALPPNRLDPDESSDDEKSSSSSEGVEDKFGPKVLKATAGVSAINITAASSARQDVSKIPELEELIYIVCAKPCEMESNDNAGNLVSGENVIMANMSEPQLKKSIAGNAISIIEYTKNNLGRLYPFGLRFDSSNADPMLAWSFGFQLAAINLQGKDRACWIGRALFQANGGCGYVKKPDVLLSSFPVNDDMLPKPSPKTFLKVRVLMGTDWHKRFDLFTKPDFYVKVAMHGMGSDALKYRTEVAHRTREPCWDGEEFKFPLRVPEIAIIRFEVWECDRVKRDEFAGQACFPVKELKPGIRVVPLNSRKGILYGSKLLVQFMMEPFKVSPS
ncbi:hypothetical protein O6H91_02G130700 [Diphasiastrum complanatum]|uniref:Uncharacterized protein n=1 Tax=Diphasiastrum complanatum TaxID=34168 RepID=A0ACC2EKZ7_DIPCM|nr:hypothetical protein O6H91_02G130700 [Diphasiastrum complanatum]